MSDQQGDDARFRCDLPCAGARVHSRVPFTQVHPDETRYSAQAFVRAAVAHVALFGVPIQRVLTDNGISFRSAVFSEACLQLGITQTFTRAYRPQANGKAERII